jgi:hypothetical protein
MAKNEVEPTKKKAKKGLKTEDRRVGGVCEYRELKKKREGKKKKTSSAKYRCFIATVT